MTMRTGTILIGVVFWAAVCLGQSWTVTTADFQRLEGDLKAVDDAGVRVQVGGAEQALPWAQVVSADHAGVKLVSGGEPFVVITRDGQRIAGAPVRLADEKLSWRNRMLGVLELPIEDVSGIVQAAAGTLPAGGGQEDLVVLANGDQLRGIIESDPDGGMAVQQQGTSTKVRWDNVKAVVLAKVGATTRRDETSGGLRIRLADGSVCQAQKLHRDGEQLHVQRDAGELKLPLGAIVSVENSGGKVRFLAGMEPKESRYVPYVQISDQQPAALKVLDEVTVDGRAYRGVIQIRPRTTLTYVSGVDGKVHLRYACARPGEMTDMDVKVLVNAKAAYEKQGVSSASVSDAVEAPVKVGDTVSIEVDYGKNFDVQDWLLLLEAAFVAR